MVKRMIMHDKRLDGGAIVLPYAQNIFEPDGDTLIANAIGWVRNYARSQAGLDQLVIMCHGFEADWDLTNQVCTGIPVGGFGLQLCKEGLGMANVTLAGAWSGLINEIVVFACSAAETGPGNQGTSADGDLLMMKLAYFSSADVIASSKTQYASWEGDKWVWDFGHWEGPIWRFDPATNTRQAVSTGGACLYLDG